MSDIFPFSGFSVQLPPSLKLSGPKVKEKQLQITTKRQTVKIIDAGKNDDSSISVIVHQHMLATVLQKTSYILPNGSV